MKKNVVYKIYDLQLGKFKEDFPAFKTKDEAYSYYGESLREQLLNGDGVYDGWTTEEIIEDLNKKSDKDLFDIFEYDVVEVTV